MKRILLITLVFVTLIPASLSLNSLFGHEYQIELNEPIFFFSEEWLLRLYNDEQGLLLGSDSSYHICEWEQNEYGIIFNTEKGRGKLMKDPLTAYYYLKLEFLEDRWFKLNKL